MSVQFHNRSSEQLADEYGGLKAQIDALTDQADAIKVELIARGDDRVEGDRFTITVTKQVSTRLDQKRLEEFFDDGELDRFKKQTESTVVRVKATAVFGQAAA